MTTASLTFPQATTPNRVIALTPSNAPDTPDERLVSAARAGDEAAFATLVERHRGVVFAYVYARLRHRDEAEDAAQEVFVRAWQQIARLRSGTAWSPWLMRVARNLCHDWHRRARVRRSEPLAPGDAELILDLSPLPESLALAAERRREMERALRDLSDLHRVPLVMHYVSGCTYAQIAEALDVPVSTVIGRMAGGLRQLRRRLNPEGRR